MYLLLLSIPAHSFLQNASYNSCLYIRFCFCFCHFSLECMLHEDKDCCCIIHVYPQTGDIVGTWELIID